VALAAALLGSGGALAQAVPPAAPVASGPAAATPPVPTVAMGKSSYTSFCARCHGINLVTASSAHFDLRTFPRDDKERFVRSVSKGLRAMPAWEGVVKPEQLEAIWLYIGSVNGWQAAAAKP
jgi:mono/diheme cytochrome c family protein